MKTKKLTLTLFILVVISVTCSTCDFGPKHGPTYLMSDEFKRYIVFPKGSYWVYEEVNSNSIDSVNLYRSELEMIDGMSKLGYSYQRFIGGSSSSFSPEDSVRYFGRPSFQDQNYYILEQFRLNDYLTSPYVFFDNKSVGFEFRYTDNITLVYEDFIPELEMNGITYSDVKVFSTNIQFFSYQSQRIFYAKDVGMIKRELFNGQVWQLKRYYINK
jgi:hypothetical protein